MDHKSELIMSHIGFHIGRNRRSYKGINRRVFFFPTLLCCCVFGKFARQVPAYDAQYLAWDTRRVARGARRRRPTRNSRCRSGGKAAGRRSLRESGIMEDIFEARGVTIAPGLGDKERQQGVGQGPVSCNREHAEPAGGPRELGRLTQDAWVSTSLALGR